MPFIPPSDGNQTNIKPHVHRQNSVMPRCPENVCVRACRGTDVALLVYPPHRGRCHVMERESFESKTVARLLNENFVSIKASREVSGREIFSLSFF